MILLIGRCSIALEARVLRPGLIHDVGATSQASWSDSVLPCPSGMFALMNPAAVFTLCMPAPQLNDCGPQSGGKTVVPLTDWPWPSAPWQTAQLEAKILAPRSRFTEAGFFSTG